MDMLNEMAVFAQVVDSGSFSAAARQAGTTTSAVSRQVARLEEHLGARLLTRTTRALSLTELGQQVYEASVRMLASAREAQALAGSYSAGPRGVLRVSAPIVFGQTWLAPRLPGFLDACPDVEVRLTLTDRQIDLIEDGVDLAIRIAPTLAPGLASRPLCRFRYVLVAAPAYLRQHGTPLTPGELAAHTCCHLGYGRFGKRWTFSAKGKQLAVDVSGRATVNNSAAMVALASAGGGICLVPAFAAQDALALGRVEQVLADWDIEAPYTGAVHMVYTPGRHMALKIRAFIDYFVASAEGDAASGLPIPQE
ncbi:LysR family transcriptional regulator [Massilia sp. CF038]|uniref:LysR family transcriptional regulator n=1 Tax=Massilia sp. CF038 TaxID=1881045 RepID=UPI00091E6D73|nr:LysR family transcriptional regulator [Massilia sp. CF038]SHG62995.1 DNA-binding transcriptional regulator, LysR family [Massilia sp. CF038]